MEPFPYLAISRLSDLSNGFPYNATEEAGEMEQQAARDLSGDIDTLVRFSERIESGSGCLTKVGDLATN